MRNVRKDVISNLDRGLDDSREYAKAHGATPPKWYHYDTRRATHNVYQDDDGRRHYNTVGYDGTRYHTSM